MSFSQFSSESVASGHPDKVCDQISDAIVDAALTIDPTSRVAVETLVTQNRIVLAGEVTCPGKLNYRQIVKGVIKSLGYTKPEYGFWHDSPVTVLIHQQSPDISMGVDDGGAGDQGMMFGYACRETPQYMPLPITLAHQLVRAMDEARTSGDLPYLRPDGKSQVVVDYRDGKPTGVPVVILAVPHDQKVSNWKLKNDLKKNFVDRILEENKVLQKNFSLIVNGTGKWSIGGPAYDTGVTGRKIIVDTYGGMGRHGGGCFSGKDATKVDRSAAYAARYLAKNIVAANLADRVEIRLGYVIGAAKPVFFDIETFGTAKKPDKFIKSFANTLLDLSVGNIINRLDLRRPIYRQTAVYGHFGNPNYPWEKLVAI
ncbi:methionine adenosyltransferase [Microgenomates group bacterium RIFCSPLOWO2_01_FULL_47_10]|nr:MAG: methionine adenosyltransferase [Microgenomates group bacterium RIFCSPLOWO2_01_FULL_47_10]